MLADFDSLASEYSKRGAPVDVSFRRLVPNLRYGERATHFLHPYPGKMLLHIANFFLCSEGKGGRRRSVFDPFCGSGTTLLEATLSGAVATGVDVNPFAVLLAKTKCTLIDPQVLIDTANRTIRRAKMFRSAPVPEIENINHWFSSNGIQYLARLRRAILECDDSTYRDCMLVAFSSAVRMVSFADPRIPVPVRVQILNSKTDSLSKQFVEVHNRACEGDAYGAFLKACTQMVERHVALNEIHNGIESNVHVECGNTIKEIPSLARARGPFNLVLTSPPYCAAQKYIRASRLSLGWLGLSNPAEQSELESMTVGREYVRRKRGPIQIPAVPYTAQETIAKIAEHNPERGLIAATYLNELIRSIDVSMNELAVDGLGIIVIGDNRVAGEILPATRVVREHLVSRRFNTVLELRDKIQSRGLITTRNFNSAPMSHEHVLVVSKSDSCSILTAEQGVYAS